MSVNRADWLLSIYTESYNVSSIVADSLAKNYTFDDSHLTTDQNQCLNENCPLVVEHNNYRTDFCILPRITT